MHGKKQMSKKNLTQLILYLSPSLCMQFRGFDFETLNQSINQSHDDSLIFFQQVSTSFIHSVYSNSQSRKEKPLTSYPNGIPIPSHIFDESRQIVGRSESSSNRAVVEG